MARNPLRFDALELFSIYGAERRLSISASGSIDSFLEELRESVTASVNNAVMLHGQRTQAMFEGMVVSLGAIRLLKQEDGGEVYADCDIKIPDFRVILSDGRHLLVEVKNFYQQEPQSPFILTQAYLDALGSYADMMKSDLKLAVYWSRWNIWTLVSPQAFARGDRQAQLPLTTAIMENEMYLLGDVVIATEPPICLQFNVSDSELTGEDEFAVTLSGYEMYCAGRKIVDPIERNIAFFMMLYGRWEPGQMAVDSSGDRIKSLRICCTPPEESGQGFEMIGSLSEMFSRFYNWATAEGNTLKQIRHRTEPGRVGRLIPADYRGQALPLWRFLQRPQTQRSTKSLPHQGEGAIPAPDVPK